MSDKDREAFEAWRGKTRCSPQEGSKEGYDDNYTNLAWRAWQAATALYAPELTEGR